ncbi:MAG: NrfD/PsrC family molybdoenzyme membrane anchor subunit [Thermomicrobiales bacterium]
MQTEEQLDRIHDVPPIAPMIERGQSYTSVTNKIDSIVLGPLRLSWLFGFGLAFAFVMLLMTAIGYLFFWGVGVWGVNIPVAWGFAIANFVWWIGIGHAGTLISAILLLLRQEWRTSINRFAEAMTLFAVACAGLFPILHLGRPWLFYWLLPYPNTMGLWPQFRSPLVWDIFAVLTYLTVSLIFWYVGMIPDLATLRDRAKRRGIRIVFGIMAFGWRGSARHWHRYKSAYLLLAALATPLVVSVHSVVSLDFAVAIVPGWHSTFFPPYFVAGAVFSGFAMVLTLAIPLRAAFRLQSLITMRHIESMAKFLLVTGLVVDYSYLMEIFMGWYSGNQFEQYLTLNRMVGFYAPLYWAVIFCNVGVTQLLWFKRVRTNTLLLFGVALLTNFGMWMERVMIVITSLQRDFMPSAWGIFLPTFWDWATLLGTIGLFFALFYLFVRLLPIISIHEMRELVHKTEPDPQGSDGREAARELVEA